MRRVSQLCPGAVLTRLEKLVEPLRATVTTKVKANAVNQEYEKQDELKRSALRAVAALVLVPGADKHPQLNEFLAVIMSMPELRVPYKAVQKDPLTLGVFGSGGAASGAFGMSAAAGGGGGGGGFGAAAAGGHDSMDIS